MPTLINPKEISQRNKQVFVLDEGEDSTDCNPRLAALQAVHLVSKVLDEAYVIANAAKDSGQPWRYLSMLKNFQNSGLDFANNEDETVEASKGDNEKENDIELDANIVATSTPQNDIELDANIVATSTPQKITARQEAYAEETLTACNDSTLIGQGDEEIETVQNDLTNSTSMFINNLFDMSEVEQVILYDDEDNLQSISEPSGLLAEAMNKIMDTYVANDFISKEDLPDGMGALIANTFPPLEDLPLGMGPININENEEGPSEILSNCDNSEYSFLADAFVADIGRDVTFYIEEGTTGKDEVYESLPTATVVEITEITGIEAVDTKKQAIKQQNEVPDNEADYTETKVIKKKNECLDYEADNSEKETIKQNNELLEKVTENTEKMPIKQMNDVPYKETNDGEKEAIKQNNEFPDIEADDAEKMAIKEDTEKEAIKQKNDFQLYENAYMTLNRDYDQCSEDDGFPILQDTKEVILQEVELITANTSDVELICPKASVSNPKEEEPVSGAIGARKSTLARRCRNQGARLFACLRGWWRRKTPLKRKESRRSGSAVCPISPNARRRSSSLLDNRLLGSPSPSHPVKWKFNTVNEALVNSNCWKDYTFDAMAEGSGDI